MLFHNLFKHVITWVLFSPKVYSVLVKGVSISSLTKFSFCVWVQALKATVGHSFRKYFNQASTFSLGTRSGSKYGNTIGKK